MKAIKITRLIILSLFLSTFGFSQKHHGKGGGHHHGHKHGVVAVKKRSVFRPRKIVVYHPHWHIKRAYNRRWIFFPKYNFYWDNWRNHYRYWNGTIWVSQASAPATIVNVNLANEKHYELKEDDDDNDEISSSNEGHKAEFKVE